jgi:hypothetical protein
VVCGSASGFRYAQFAKAGWADDQPNPPAFEATVLPNRTVLHWLWKYLGNPANPKTAKPPPNILLLQESNTAFGESVTHHGPRHAEADPDQPHVFRVPYPLHISQLRASYEQQQAARLESRPVPHVGRDLPFPAEGINKEAMRRSEVTAQAPLMTATVNDLILNNLVTTMEQKQAQHVCIISTDPQDQIFLARLIRDRYPDVQLATTEGDLLFTHEDYNYALRGMITASTYPLHMDVQRWSQPGAGSSDQLRILFSHQSFQGCYNAALVHLAEFTTDGMDDNGKAQLRAAQLQARMLDYGWEGPTYCHRSTVPPIWFGVVAGNGQLVPVGCVGPQDYFGCNGEDDLTYVYKRPDNTAPRTPEFHIRMPSMAFLLFLVVVATNIYFFRSACRYLSRSSWDQESPVELCCQYKQRLDFGAICLVQAIFYGRVALWALTPLLTPYFWSAIRGWAGQPRLSLRMELLLPDLATAIVFLVSTVMVGVSWIWLYRSFLREAGGWHLSACRSRIMWLISHSAPLELFSGREQHAVRIPRPSLWGWLVRSGFWLVVANGLMFLLVSFVVDCFLVRGIVAVMQGIRVEDALQFEQLAHLSSGVSPLLPRGLFCAALFAWGYCLVKKLYLAKYHGISQSFPECQSSSRFAKLRALDGDVHDELLAPSTLRLHFLPCVMIFGIDSLPPVDGPLVGFLSIVAFGVGIFLLLFTLLHFWRAWQSLRRLLRSLALLPMQGAFERLGDKATTLFGHYLFSLRPRHSHLALAAQQFVLLRKLYPAFRSALSRKKSLPADLLAAASTEVQKAFPESEFRPDVAGVFESESTPAENLAGASAATWGRKTAEECQQLAGRCLRVLEVFWPLQSMETAFGRPSQSRAAVAAPEYLGLKPDDPIRQWLVAAEDFVAGEIMRYLSQFTAQLRTLLTSLTLASLLLLLSVTVYPFIPQHQLVLGFTILAGLVAVAIGMFLVQLNRDELISRISGTPPNQFTPDLTFIQETASYVLPIIAALVIQFPFVTSALRSLFEPLFHIIH